MEPLEDDTALRNLVTTYFTEELQYPGLQEGVFCEIKRASVGEKAVNSLTINIIRNHMKKQLHKYRANRAEQIYHNILFNLPQCIITCSRSLKLFGVTQSAEEAEKELDYKTMKLRDSEDIFVCTEEREDQPNAAGTVEEKERKGEQAFVITANHFASDPVLMEKIVRVNLSRDNCESFVARVDPNLFTVLLNGIIILEASNDSYCPRRAEIFAWVALQRGIKRVTIVVKTMAQNEHKFSRKFMKDLDDTFPLTVPEEGFKTAMKDGSKVIYDRTAFTHDGNVTFQCEYLVQNRYLARFEEAYRWFGGYH